MLLANFCFSNISYDAKCVILPGLDAPACRIATVHHTV